MSTSTTPSLEERAKRLRNIETFVHLLADVTSRTPDALVQEMHDSRQGRQTFEFNIEHVPLEMLKGAATEAFGARVAFDEANARIRIDDVYYEPVEQAIRAISKPIETPTPEQAVGLPATTTALAPPMPAHELSAMTALIVTLAKAAGVEEPAQLGM